MDVVDRAYFIPCDIEQGVVVNSQVLSPGVGVIEISLAASPVLWGKPVHALNYCVGYASYPVDQKEQHKEELKNSKPYLHTLLYLQVSNDPPKSEKPDKLQQIKYFKFSSF